MLARFGSFFLVFQVKGCKIVTLDTSNDGTGDVGASVANAERNFWQCYDQLDPSIMKERTNGELYLDIGHEILPIPRRSPVVGFWRMEGMLASYHTAGWATPTYHSWSTSREVGSAQAVMHPNRRPITHVVGRQDYQGTYSFVRPSDNSRTLFQLPEGASTIPQKYRRQVRELGTLYELETNETETSYPVRIEFRIGAAALPSYMSSIESLVRNILVDSSFSENTNLHHPR